MPICRALAEHCAHVIVADVQEAMAKKASNQLLEEGLSPEASYSWGIQDWGITTEEELRILGYALANRSFKFSDEKYQAWVDYIGDDGVCYVGSGYSGMGQLLGYWMGIEGTIFATFDWAETVMEVVDQINNNNLKLIDTLANSPLKCLYG